MSQHTRKKPNVARRCSPKIRYETDGRNLTSQAGLVAVIKFLDGLGFSGLFHPVVHHERRPNAYFPLVNGVFLVLVSLMGGARSLRDCLFRQTLTSSLRFFSYQATKKDILSHSRRFA